MEGLTATLSIENKTGCRFIQTCRDISKLKRSYAIGNPDENLLDQYYELCSCGSFGCSLRDFYLEQSNQRRK